MSYMILISILLLLISYLSGYNLIIIAAARLRDNCRKACGGKHFYYKIICVENEVNFAQPVKISKIFIENFKIIAALMELMVSKQNC